jgi:MFS family permease
VAERRPRLFTPAFAVVTAAGLAYFTSIGATLPVLPRYIKGSLGGGGVAVGFGVGAFSISAVFLRPFVGRLGDRIGRRPIMVGGGVIAASSIVLYGMIDSIWWLVFLRLITGVGEALFFTGATTAVQDLAPDARRGEAASLFSLSLFGGLAAGPLLGEWILGKNHFDAVWLVSALIGLGTAVLALGYRDVHQRVDAVEPAPVIYRGAIAPGLALSMNVTGFAAFAAFMPLYAVEDLDLSGSRFVFALYAIVVLLIRLFGARLPDVVGPRRVSSAAALFVATGLGTMALWRSSLGLYVATVIFSVGHALAFPALLTLAVQSAPASKRGAAVGTFTAFFDIAYGFGAVPLGAVVALTGNRGAFVAASIAAFGGFTILRTVKQFRAPGVR